MSCFIFVELTVLTKISLRTISIISLHAQYPQIPLSAILLKERGRSGLVCTYDIAYLFGITFFTVAMILNAARWVYLIFFLQRGVKTSKFKGQMLKVSLGLYFLLLAASTLYRMVEECKDPVSNEQELQQAVLFYSIIIQSLNVAAIVIYSLACYHNTKYLQ